MHTINIRKTSFLRENVKSVLAMPVMNMFLFHLNERSFSLLMFVAEGNKMYLY
jgi:hypothetical protein